MGLASKFRYYFHSHSDNYLAPIPRHFDDYRTQGRWKCLWFAESCRRTKKREYCLLFHYCSIIVFYKSAMSSLICSAMQQLPSPKKLWKERNNRHFPGFFCFSPNQCKTPTLLHTHAWNKELQTCLISQTLLWGWAKFSDCSTANLFQDWMPGIIDGQVQLYPYEYIVEDNEWRRSWGFQWYAALLFGLEHYRWFEKLQ